MVTEKGQGKQRAVEGETDNEEIYEEKMRRVEDRMKIGQALREKEVEALKSTGKPLSPEKLKQLKYVLATADPVLKDSWSKFLVDDCAYGGQEANPGEGSTIRKQEASSTKRENDPNTRPETTLNTPYTTLNLGAPRKWPSRLTISEPLGKRVSLYTLKREVESTDNHTPKEKPLPPTPIAPHPGIRIASPEYQQIIPRLPKSPNTGSRLNVATPDEQRRATDHLGKYPKATLHINNAVWNDTIDSINTPHMTGLSANGEEITSLFNRRDLPAASTAPVEHLHEPLTQGSLAESGLPSKGSSSPLSARSPIDNPQESRFPDNGNYEASITSNQAIRERPIPSSPIPSTLTPKASQVLEFNLLLDPKSRNNSPPELSFPEHSNYEDSISKNRHRQERHTESSPIANVLSTNKLDSLPLAKHRDDSSKELVFPEHGNYEDSIAGIQTSPSTVAISHNLNKPFREGSLSTPSLSPKTEKSESEASSATITDNEGPHEHHQHEDTNTFSPTSPSPNPRIATLSPSDISPPTNPSPYALSRGRSPVSPFHSTKPLTWTTAFTTMLASPTVPAEIKDAVDLRAREIGLVAFNAHTARISNSGLKEMGLVPNFSYPVDAAPFYDRYASLGVPLTGEVELVHGDWESGEEESIGGRRWGGRGDDLILLHSEEEEEDIVSETCSLPSLTYSDGQPFDEHPTVMTPDIDGVASKTLYHYTPRHTHLPNGVPPSLSDTSSPSHLSVPANPSSSRSISTPDHTTQIRALQIEVAALIARNAELENEILPTLTRTRQAREASLRRTQSTLDDLRADIIDLKIAVDYSNKILGGCWAREHNLVTLIHQIRERKKAMKPPQGLMKMSSANLFRHTSRTKKEKEREKGNDDLKMPEGYEWQGFGPGEDPPGSDSYLALVNGTATPIPISLTKPEIEQLAEVAEENLKALRQDVKEMVTIVQGCKGMGPGIQEMEGRGSMGTWRDV